MQDITQLPEWLSARKVQEIGIWEYGLLPTEKIPFGRGSRALPG